MPETTCRKLWSGEEPGEFIVLWRERLRPKSLEALIHDLIKCSISKRRVYDNTVRTAGAFYRKRRRFYAMDSFPMLIDMMVFPWTDNR
jgi:hypothetical protein